MIANYLIITYQTIRERGEGEKKEIQRGREKERRERREELQETLELNAGVQSMLFLSDKTHHKSPFLGDKSPMNFGIEKLKPKVLSLLWC